MTTWTAVVGFSGTGKTPGIDCTKRALSQVERDRKTKISDMQRKHEARVEAAKAARAQWKETVKEKVVQFAEAKQSANKLKETVDPMPADAVDPGPFVPERLFVSNTTIEKLADLFQARPQGMLMLADELSALFLNMSRYSGGQDNEFWLEAWNGGHYRLERRNRPSVDISHLLCGVVGGLQPDKLARSFNGDLDGMYARVCFSWPEEPAFAPLTDNVDEVEPAILNALNRIVKLESSWGDDVFVPTSIKLSDEARSEFEAFRKFVHAEKHVLDGRVREWWAKTPAHVLRLTGTLCYLSWAMVGGDEPKEIDQKFMRASIELVRDYFWPHSRASLRQIGLSDQHATKRRVLQWIKTNNKTEVSREDVRRDALGQTLDAEQTQQLLDAMAKLGWLKRVATESAKKGGRPALRWLVNPVLSAPAEIAEIHAEAENGHGGFRSSRSFRTTVDADDDPIVEDTI